jgi:hypothetical protein
MQLALSNGQTGNLQSRSSLELIKDVTVTGGCLGRRACVREVTGSKNILSALGKQGLLEYPAG